MKRAVFIAALNAAAFALTVWIFYPGIMTYDARYIYQDAMAGKYGDWQSPVMTWLWAAIDPLAPGSASMFLLMAALYWIGWGIVTIAIRRSLWLAVAIVGLALMPPLLPIIGVIWRDGLFASLWLIAAGVTLISADMSGRWRIVGAAVAVALVGFGVLLRPNAIPAAPLLIAYAFWPRALTVKRLALSYIPIAVACFVLMQGVYYGALGAQRQNPLHSLFVFDLGGITHFSKTNQFPVAWTPEQDALLTTDCYKPQLWDVYWTWKPCDFVMKRLEGDGVFGKPELRDAWLNALRTQPLAYLRHRLAVTGTLLLDANLVMWTRDLEWPHQNVFSEKPAFQFYLTNLYGAFAGQPPMRLVTWLVLCLVLAATGLALGSERKGAFMIAVAGSGAIYLASYGVLGVATDFRYGYWAAVAALAAGAIFAARSIADDDAALQAPVA